MKTKKFLARFKTDILFQDFEEILINTYRFLVEKLIYTVLLNRIDEILLDMLLLFALFAWSIAILLGDRLHNNVLKSTGVKVKYNVSEGRLPGGSWCKIEIIPSHLGLSVSDANSPSWQAKYSLYLPYWSRSNLIQITASKDGNYRWTPALINSATSYFRDSGTQWVDFTISWATETLELYVGMINSTNKYDPDEYCSVWSIQYGACASYQAPDGNCSSVKI